MITIQDSILNNSGTPLDYKSQVNTYADLVNIPYKYKGLKTLVLDENKTYRCKEDLTFEPDSPTYAEYEVDKSTLQSSINANTANIDLKLDKTSVQDSLGSSVNNPISQNAVTSALQNTAVGLIYEDTYKNGIANLTLLNLIGKEVITLNITGAATASDNIVIGLHGVSYNVAITSGDTIAGIVAKIISEATYGTWNPVSSSPSVVFTNGVVGTGITPTFSGGTTGVTGNISVTTVGFVPVTGLGIVVLDQTNSDGVAYIYQYNNSQWNRTPYTQSITLVQTTGSSASHAMSQGATTNTIANLSASGYLYLGIATTSTTPTTYGVNDRKYYLYNAIVGSNALTNFGGLSITETEDSIYTIKWNGSNWVSEKTNNSSNTSISGINTYLDNNTPILQSKFGFVEGGNIVALTSSGVRYWVSDMLNNSIRNFSVISGINIEVTHRNLIIKNIIELVKIDSNNNVTILATKDIYKDGIYTIIFGSPISVSKTDKIGFCVTSLNENSDYNCSFIYKTNTADPNSLYEYLGNGTSATLVGTLPNTSFNLSLILKNERISEISTELSNRILTNLGFFSNLIPIVTPNEDTNFMNVQFSGLLKGVSFVDYNGGYIDNSAIVPETDVIKIPKIYAIIAIAIKRKGWASGDAKLITWGIGATEQGVYSNYNSEKVLDSYRDWSINVIAYYADNKINLNSINNINTSISGINTSISGINTYLDNNTPILQSKFGFVEGGIIGYSGASGIRYWTFDILNGLVGGFQIIGVIVEVGKAGVIEVVSINRNTLAIQSLVSQSVSKSGIYEIYFTSPVLADSSNLFGVNSSNIGHSSFRYKLNNSDYGMSEYYYDDTTSSIKKLTDYNGATLNFALLTKRNPQEKYLLDLINNYPLSAQYLPAPIIYNTYIDAKGQTPIYERSYQSIIQLDHLLNGLSSEYKIRFGNNKDVIQKCAPVYANGLSNYPTATYIALDGNIFNEYIETIKVNNNNNELYEFLLANRCTRTSVTKNKKPLVLCIGDSITYGFGAVTEEDNFENTYSFHDICKEMFMKDNVDNGGMGYEIEMLGTNKRERQSTYNGNTINVTTYHEGYGGSSAATWLNGTANTKFIKDSSNLFSINAWVNKYRTMDDYGNKLYFDNNKSTIGVAGDNWGYLSDGTQSNLKLGTLVSDVTIYNVCVPTHININLGTNGITTIAQWQSFIDIIHSEYPNIIIGLSVFDTAGTYFPSLHKDYDDSFTYWNEVSTNPNIGISANSSYHNTQWNTQYNLGNFYEKESEKIYVLPFFYCTPSVESATYRKLNTPMDDLLLRNYNKIMYGWGGVYHINPLAHGYCAYQLYSWIKWTMKD